MEDSPKIMDQPMRCPVCGYEGRFKKVKPYFLSDSLDESDRARRSLICPQCDTTITLPRPKPGMLFTAVLVVVVIALAASVASFAWQILH
jgi:hypothetical protein